MLSSHDGYTTNLPLEDFLSDGALLATHWQGRPLTRDHGAPMRALVPHLYFWKGAKWLRGIESMAADRAGFWEAERLSHVRRPLARAALQQRLIPPTTNGDPRPAAAFPDFCG